jgi:hypothetical protein
LSTIAVLVQPAAQEARRITLEHATTQNQTRPVQDGSKTGGARVKTGKNHWTWRRRRAQLRGGSIYTMSYSSSNHSASGRSVKFRDLEDGAGDASRTSSKMSAALSFDASVGLLSDASASTTSSRRGRLGKPAPLRSVSSAADANDDSPFRFKNATTICATCVEIKLQAPHAIDATLSPELHLLDGVEQTKRTG